MLFMQFDFTTLTIQLGKYSDLALQKHRFYRLCEIINSTGVIPLELKLEIFHSGGDKDDRDMPGLWICPHQFRCLETIHFRHLHIQKHQGEILLERQAKGLISRQSTDKLVPLVTEKGFQ